MPNHKASFSTTPTLGVTSPSYGSSVFAVGSARVYKNHKKWGGENSSIGYHSRRLISQPTQVKQATQATSVVKVKQTDVNHAVVCLRG